MAVFDSDALFSEAVQRLREAAHQDRSFDAAKMQLINLPEIIRNAGAHWPLMKDKIRLGSLHFLKGCLAKDDIVIPAGDGFLIIFADGESASLKQRANDLRGLLLEFYLGQETLDKLKVDVQCQTVRADQLHTLLGSSPEAPQADDVFSSAFAFAPIWTLRASMIGTYLCTPRHQEPSGVRFGYDEGFLQSGRSSHRDYCATDLSLLDTVEAALDRYTGDAVRPALCVSVHVTTLASRSARAAYLERLSRTPKDKLKYMFMRIAEIDVGTPMINIADWVGMLRARVRHVQAEFHYSQVPSPNLTDLCVFSAGFRSPPAFERPGGSAKASAIYQLWGATLARQRLLLFIDSVRRVPLIKSAVDAGVSFMTNDEAWPNTQWPGGIVSDVNPLETPEPDVFFAAS